MKLVVRADPRCQATRHATRRRQRTDSSWPISWQPMAKPFSERTVFHYRHRKVMQRIIACRTAALGGHRDRCEQCGYERSVYHSCRNRHCPKCQMQAKEVWRAARTAELLPVPYFHQVFTLPHEFNEWILASEENQRALLKLLFDSAAGTLLAFGRGELGWPSRASRWCCTPGTSNCVHTFMCTALMPSGALSDDDPSLDRRWSEAFV